MKFVYNLLFYFLVLSTPSALVAQNSSPIADAGGIDLVYAHNSLDVDYSLNGSGSSDPDGDPITFEWQQVFGPAVTLDDNTLEQPSFTIPASPEGSPPIVLEFQLTVSDGTSSNQDVTTINIESNRSPIADAGGDGTVESETSTVRLNGSGSSDPDPGLNLYYSWEEISGENIDILTPNDEIAFFDAPYVPFEGNDKILTFELTVQDDFGGISTDTVNYTILASKNNTPPDVNAGVDQTVVSESTVDLSGVGTDIDNHSLSYSWTEISTSGVTLSGNTTANPSFTAPSMNIGDPAQILTFEVTVDDGFGGIATDTVNITVEGPPNTPPQVTTSADKTVASSSNNTEFTTSLSSDGFDFDGHTLTYSWVETTSSGVTLMNDTSLEAEFINPIIPNGNPDEVLTFEVTVDDGFGGVVTDTINITVEANNIPVSDAGPDQTVASGSTVTLNGTLSSDPDNHTLEYSWSQISGENISLSDTSTDSPSFTAPTLVNGAENQILEFELVTTDGTDSSVSDNVTITINSDPNTNPVANAGFDEIITSGETLTLDGSSSVDTDTNQALSYSWTQISGETANLSNATTDTPTLTAPTLINGASDELLTIELTVEDGFGGSSTDTMVITVQSDTNTTPIADAGSDQTVISNSNVTLDGSASSETDIGQTLDYLWAQTSGTSVTLNDITIQQPVFTAPSLTTGSDDSILTFDLVVNDGFGGIKTDSVAITVYANTAPVANAGPDQTVFSEETVTLDATGSTDTDSHPLSYTWVQLSGETATLSNANTAQPTFTAPAMNIGDPAQILTFEVTVDDGFGGTSIDTVIINVESPTNIVPIADAGADQDISSTVSTISLDGSNSLDGNGDILSFNWMQISGAPVTLNNSQTANPTFENIILNSGDTDQVLEFELTVNDGKTGISSDTVIVRSIAPPIANAGPDQEVFSGETVELNSSTSNDINGHIITYEWTQISGDIVTLSDNNSSNPTFSSPTMDMLDNPKELVFEVKVENSFGSIATDQIMVLVKPAIVNKVGFVSNFSLSNDLNNNGLVNRGDTLKITYEISNLGNLDYYNLEIIEALIGGTPLYQSGGSDSDSINVKDLTLNDANLVYETEYVVTIADANNGIIKNQASVVAFDEDQTSNEVIKTLSGNNNDNNMMTTINVEPYVPQINLTKSSVINDGNNGKVEAGDQIIYTYEIQNTGNTKIFNITVSEIPEKFSGTGTLPQAFYISGGQISSADARVSKTASISASNTIVDLDFGDTAIFRSEYTLTEADVEAGSVSSQAIGKGEDVEATQIIDGGDESGSEDTLTTTAEFAIIKTGEFLDGGDGLMDIGDQIKYTFIVHNTGNKPIFDVHLTETTERFDGNGVIPTIKFVGSTSNSDLDGESDRPDLASGSNTLTYEAVYTIVKADLEQGVITNQASGVASAENGLSVTSLSGTRLGNTSATTIKFPSLVDYIKEEVQENTRRDLENVLRTQLKNQKSITESARSRLKDAEKEYGKNCLAKSEKPFSLNAVANDETVKIDGQYYKVIRGCDKRIRTETKGYAEFTKNGNESETVNFGFNYSKERQVDDKTVRGYNVTIAKQDTDINNSVTGKSSNINGFLGAYQIKEIMEDVYLDLFGSVGYGQHNMEFRKNKINAESNLNHFSATAGATISADYKINSKVVVKPEAYAMVGKNFGGEADVTANNSQNNISEEGKVQIEPVDLVRYGAKATVEYKVNKNTTVEVSPGVVCENGTITNQGCGYSGEVKVKVQSDDDSTLSANVGVEKIGDDETTYGGVTYEKKINKNTTLEGGIKAQDTLDNIMAFFGIKIVF